MNRSKDNRKTLFMSLVPLFSVLLLIFFPLKASAAGTAVFNGTDFSPIYDFEYYTSHYPDVAALFGNDPQGALAHFILFGIAEGRQGCEPVQAATQSEGPLAGFTVILDAGHGGRDPGCVRNGVYEKNVNLMIVYKTAAMLQAQGATVLMTRPDDSYVCLEYRYCFQNIHPEAVFVSIHCNALASNTSFSGINAFCNASCNENSDELAACVYSGTLFATGARGRGIRTDSNLRVNRYSTIPSVLMEVGYLSSRTEFQLLTSSDYQDLIAAGITNGIMTYKELLSTTQS